MVTVEVARVLERALIQKVVDHKMLYKLHLQVGVAALVAVAVEETVGIITDHKRVSDFECVEEKNDKEKRGDFTGCGDLKYTPENMVNK